MPIFKVISNGRGTGGRSSSESISYVMDEQAHRDDASERYLYASGIGCIATFSQSAEAAFAGVRALHKKRGIKVQAYHAIQSFALHELDPNNPEHQRLAHKVGVAMAEASWPGRMVVVITQRDGESGLLHNHFVINSLATETGLSIRGDEARWVYLAPIHDQVCASMGLAQGPEMPQPTIPEFKTNTAHDRYAATRVGYSYRAELLVKIEQARSTALDIGDYVLRLAANGVDAEMIPPRPGSKRRGRAVYTFTDSHGLRHELRSNDLGRGTGYRGVADVVAGNARECVAHAEATTLPELPTAPTALVVLASPSGGVGMATTQVLPWTVADAQPEASVESFDDIEERLRRTRAAWKPKTPARARYLASKQRQLQKQWDREYGD